jgi:hypothetical protein
MKPKRPVMTPERAAELRREADEAQAAALRSHRMARLPSGRFVDLCGEELCPEVAQASYRIKTREVFLCARHLAELCMRSRMTLTELSKKLPGFALLS